MQDHVSLSGQVREKAIKSQLKDPGVNNCKLRYKAQQNIKDTQSSLAIEAQSVEGRSVDGSRLTKRG